MRIYFSKKTVIGSIIFLLSLITIFFVYPSNRLKSRSAEYVKEKIVEYEYCNNEDVNLIDGGDVKLFDTYGVHTLSASMKNDITLIFYDYEEEKFFNDVYDTFMKGITFTSKFKGKNYIISEHHSDAGYSLVTRVDSSMLYLSGRKEYEEDIKNIASELGYYRQ